MKKGVLLVNLGTPNSPSRGDVYTYLKQFLLDPRVIDINPVSRNLLVRGIIAPFRSGNSAKLYQKLWTDKGSPIKIYGYSLKEKVQKILGDDYVVALGMRYQEPSIEKALEELRQAKVGSIVVFPLFPQYASASTGSAHQEVMRIVSKWLAIPDLRFINSYYDQKDMIEIFAQNALKHDPKSFDHVLMSFHGIPERQMIKTDIGEHCLKKPNCCQTITEDNQFCYKAQCHATAKALAARLALNEEDYTICFQSRLGKAEWVKPYTTDVLKIRREKGDKRLLVFSAAFVADCLETTIEISEEYTEEWQHMGGEKVQLVESLNDKDEWAEAVSKMVAGKPFNGK